MLDKPASCQPCPFYTRGIGFVPAAGPADAHIRFCGEAPGEEEANSGVPWYGPAGQELEQAARLGGTDWEGSYRYNTIQCRPPGNDYALVPREAVEFCQSIHTIPAPRRSVEFLVGAHALAMRWPQLRSESISKWQGSLLERDQSRQIPLYHPAFIKRGQWHLRPLLSINIRAGLGALEGLTAPLRVGHCKPGASLALDVETTRQDKLEVVGVSTDGVQVAQYPPDPVGLLEVERLIESADVVYAHNAKFDVTRLEAAGVRLDRRKVVDTQIAMALLWSDLESGLDDALSVVLAGRWRFHKHLTSSPRVKEEQRRACREVWAAHEPSWAGMSEAEWDGVYNMLDVAGTWRLGVEQRRQLGG